MIISLHSSPRKTKKIFSILCMHVGIKCTSNRLCVCPFRLCGVGCATANWHSRFKPADQLYCPVQFPLSCVTSWWDDFCFQSFQITCQSWKRAPRGYILSKNPTELSSKNISTEECIVRSMQTAHHVKCSACFLRLFCLPWQNVRRQTTHQLEASHQQRKSNRKYAEDFPLICMGCEMLSSQHLDVFQDETLFNFFL